MVCPLWLLIVSQTQTAVNWVIFCLDIGEHHRRKGQGVGQRLRGEALAERQIRRGLSERLREYRASGESPEKVLSVLQSRAAASVARV
jgi:hypothetical protein